MPALRVIEPGTVFGRLRAITHSVGAGEQKRVLCECMCGTVREFRAKKLVTGETVGCGCYGRERAAEAHTKHGELFTREYASWKAMLARVRNPRNIGFMNYGGRGISVCDRWKDYAAFREDMGERPLGHSLDRIDVNGNYEPGNCRWADSRTQAANKRKRSK